MESYAFPAGGSLSNNTYDAKIFTSRFNPQALAASVERLFVAFVCERCGAAGSSGLTMIRLTSFFAAFASTRE
jgi:hypothetical protein